MVRRVDGHENDDRITNLQNQTGVEAAPRDNTRIQEVIIPDLKVNGAEVELNPTLNSTNGQPQRPNTRGSQAAAETAALRQASEQIYAGQTDNDKILSVAEINAKYDTQTVKPLQSKDHVTSETLTALKEQRTQTEGEITTAQQNYNDLITSNTGELKTKKETVNEKQNLYLKALDESDNDEIKQIREEVKQVENDIKSTEEEIRNYSAEITKVDSEIKNNDGQLKIVEGKISSYTTHLSYLQSQLSAATDDKVRVSIQAKINDTHTKKNEATSDKENLLQKQSDLDNKKNDLESNKEKSEGELKTLKETKTEFDNKIKASKDEAVKKALDEYNNAKADYESAVKKSETEQNQLKDTLTEKRLKLELLDSQIAAEEQKIILEEERESARKAAETQASAAASSSGYASGGGGYVSGGGSYVGGASGGGDVSSTSGASSSTLTETPIGDLNYDKNKQYTAEGLKKAMEGHPYASKLSLEFFQKVLDLANELKCNPCDLLAMMNSESGIKPDSYNSQYHAGGLIGFMTPTAQSLGTTVDALIKMSPEEQLKYVRECLLKAKKMAYGDMNKELSGGDLYAMNFLPAYAKNDVLTTKGTNFYTHNAVLDYDKDDDIDKKDMETRLGKFYIASLKQYRDNGETSTT